jgi:hypothetical protein
VERERAPSELDGEGCAPPGSAGPTVEEQKDVACIICRKKMYYAEEFRVSVCLNEEHGVLAYYGLDDCYFTSREDVGLRLAKEGKKFHMIEADVLKMMGVKS